MNEPVESQEAVFRFLADPRTHGLTEAVGRVDTAGAVVFLAGPNVYKVKRAVRFPFMDFSTLDKRRQACEAEIAVNRDNAPGIYLEAAPIVRKGDSSAIGGAGEVVEWVAHLRRFDENATLDRIAERDGVSDAIIDRLAVAIRRSHARAPLRDAARAAHELEVYIEQNDAAFAGWPELFPPAGARRLTHEFAARLRRCAADAPLARGASGYVRRCHGDLHLRNIALIEGEPVLFRRGRVFRRDRQRRRALRSGVSSDGSRGARPEARREPAVQSLSGPRAAGGAGGPRRSAAVHEPSRRDPGKGRGGQARTGSRARSASAPVRSRAAISIAPPRFFTMSAAARRRRRPFGGGQERARRQACAAARPRARARSGCAATSSARDVRRSEDARLSDDGLLPRTSRREVYRRIDEKARRALRAGHSVVLDATFANGRDAGRRPMRRRSRRRVRRPFPRGAAR